MEAIVSPGYRAILAARITINYCKNSYPGMGIYPFSNNYRHLLFIPVYNGLMNYEQIKMPNGFHPRQMIPELYSELFKHLIHNSTIAEDCKVLARFNMVERYLMYATEDLQKQIAQVIWSLNYERTNETINSYNSSA